MSRQLITFEIGDRRLGIDIMAIREIRAWSPTTPLPNVPAHVRGVVNLRGVVLPVIDLSQRLGWGTTDFGDLDLRSIGIATFGALVLLLIGRLVRGREDS